MSHRLTTGPDRDLSRVRGWAYRLIAPAAALAGAYGIISEDRIPLWVALAAAVLGNATAAANTPVQK